jgi:hypothetical protein
MLIATPRPASRSVYAVAAYFRELPENMLVLIRDLGFVPPEVCQTG